MDTTDMYPFKLIGAPLFVWLMVAVVGLIFLFLSDYRIVSDSPFTCNWQSMLWDSEPIVTRFSSNTGGNLDIRIP